MFACQGSIWRRDDFTRCFEQDYLQTLFPLVACGLSLFHILIQVTQGAITVHQEKGYTAFNGANHVSRNTQGIDEEGDDHIVGGTGLDEEAEENPLTLQKTVSTASKSTVKISHPRGELVLVIVEILALCGEIVVNLVGLLERAWGRHARIASISSICVWGYILLLAGLRLVLPKLKHNPLPKLWNHTAALYCIQWFFRVILFRSAIIHPYSHTAQVLMIIDFGLATVLALIAITGRKGNSAVLLEHEDNLEPSLEPLASLLSIATFGWVDPIVWKGYKKTLELPDVWNLRPKDKAANVLVEFRQLKKTSKLAWRLLRHFKRHLLLQQFWTILSSLLTFAPTLLLKSILEYVERPEDVTAATAWLFVILLPVSGITSSIADGQGLWIGRKICIRLRAIMVAEIYAKTLRRRAAIGEDADLSDTTKKTSDKATASKSLKEKALSLFSKKGATEDGSHIIPEDKKDTQINSGTIINMMSVDTFKVADISAYLHFLIPSVPVQLVVAVTLLYRILGWSSIAGISVMLLLMPLNIFFARQFSSVQKRIMAGTDGRIHATNEVMQNIRIIKYFAWEQRFAQNVSEKRMIELSELRYKFIVWAFAATVFYGVPMLITGFSFFLYTAVEKKDLVPSVAFTALSLFGLLRYPLDRLADMVAHVLESKVSIDRIERFLNEEETGKYDQLSRAEQNGEEEGVVGFENATFTWAGREEPSGQENRAFRMINLDVKFHVSCLNIVAGPTGSGKTSLLMALLGEMTILDGRVHLPGGSREDLKADPATGLTENVAYCAQQAWLVNDTIKQNITFASPFDELRYNSVIDACALRRDLEVLDAGDSTLVGEKGIVVSGGQKQRISLARALYCNSRHVLLDDCLSAVDSHTAQHIFEQCILGPLMQNRTCILVTHNVALCVPRSKHVVVLANGKIAAQGTPEEVMMSGLLGEDISRPTSKSGTRQHSRSNSMSNLLDDESNGAHDHAVNGKANGHTNGNSEVKKPKKQSQEDGKVNMMIEKKAEGAVDWRVIRLYFASMGSIPFWILTVFMFAVEPLSQMSTNIWIRQWANSYRTEDIHIYSSISTSNASQVTHVWNTNLSTSVWAFASKWSIPFYPSTSSRLSALVAPSGVDISYYLGVYALLATTYIVICIVRLLVLFYGSLHASRVLHHRLLEAVLRAKFKFFDTTPLGQIMNRFSKDLQAVDQEVALVAAGCVQGVLNIIVIVALITIITPGFLIAAAVLGVVYFCIGMFYIRSSRDLKRLESVQRSPLYQQFGETLSGIITIRAYGDERRFTRDNFARINTHNRPFIYLWAANRWLAVRIGFTGAFVAFSAAAFVVSNVGKIDPGAAGLSLTYALTFNESVFWLVRLYADNEQNMNHVERVKTYLEIEQEAAANIPETKPPGNWPSKGNVEFVNYSTRYRSDLDQVLKKLTIKIEAEEKVGIVGRTGAGKSSLAMALFRGLEADEGQILIDDIDIAKIGLQDLRENITIVPQDPTLFTGTLRTNLDPFGLFTDEEIFTALRRVHLIGSTSSATAASTRPATPGPGESSTDTPSSSQLAAPSNAENNKGNDLTKVTTNTRENTNVFVNLSSSVAESGSNLSQGQRQLLCLARALLKSPRVLLMDEATASIDYATDAKIQTTLRELKGSTIITIAHRLQTIIDYDKVLVLDKGEVVEYDAPWTLIQKEGSVFRGMCEMTGDFDTLMEGAKKAEREGKLVDV